MYIVCTRMQLCITAIKNKADKEPNLKMVLFNNHFHSFRHTYIKGSLAGVQCSVSVYKLLSTTTAHMQCMLLILVSL